MAEWLKAAVLKTVSGETRSGVRIPLPPPNYLYYNQAFKTIVGLPCGGIATRLWLEWSKSLGYAQAGSAQDHVSVPLRECLDIALTILSGEIAESGTKITCGPLPTIHADRVQLKLVFQNLIANSIKFRSVEAPRIEIQVGKQDNQYVVSITDIGQGFDPQYADRIFAPFKRLHGPEVPGSGIGLASCRRIVEMLGGRIWAEAEPGRGATFRFTVPR